MSNWSFRINGSLSTRIVGVERHAVRVQLQAFAGRVIMTALPWDPLQKQRVSFESCGHDSEEAARAAAEGFRMSAILGAALDWLSLKFRDSATVFRSDVAAGSTIEDQGHREIRIGTLDGVLSAGAALGGTASERQLISAGLISDSLLLPNAGAQLVMRMSAIEALCDQGDLPESDLAVIRGLIDTVIAEPELTEDARIVVASALSNAKGLTARAAVRAKIRALLGAEYLPAFDKLYSLRSGIVHDGLYRGKLAHAAHDALAMATALLRADLRAGAQSPVAL